MVWMFDFEEFDEEFSKAMVRVAKLKAKGLGLEEATKKLMEEKDLYGLLSIGMLVGAVNGLHGMGFARNLFHNFTVCVDRLLKGEDEKKILEELRRVEMEERREEFMVYGG